MHGSEEFEKELQTLLRHIPPPAGFADRVLARAAARHRGRRLAPVARVGWWAAAAAVCLTIGGEAVHLHRVREAERQQATTQLTLALALTHHALAAVQGNIDRSPAGRYTRALQESITQDDTTGGASHEASKP